MKNSLFFFSRLESLRKKRSKADFCRDIGISTPLYQKWAKGSIPGGDKLQLISQACGVSVEWLLGGDGADPPDPSRPPLVAETCVCRYPENCDLKTELAAVREELAALGSLAERMDRIENTLQQVERLLGIALGKALTTRVPEHKRSAG